MQFAKKYLEQPKMPDGSLSDWDARQLYVRNLQEIDELTNSLKMRIELRDGTAEEMKEFFNVYFTLLRNYYRNIMPFFSKKETKDNDDKIKNFLISFKNFNSQDTKGKLSKLTIPHTLEKELEDFYNVLNQKRFESRLVIPVSKTERFDKGKDMIIGYDE